MPLERWLSSDSCCRAAAFSELAVVNAVIERLSSGLIESINTRTRLNGRRGFGFRTVDAVIAFVMLTLGSDRPTRPGRQLTSVDPRTKQKSLF